jgi:hypothetical protein
MIPTPWAITRMLLRAALVGLLEALILGSTLLALGMLGVAFLLKVLR